MLGHLGLKVGTLHCPVTLVTNQHALYKNVEELNCVMAKA